MREIKIKICGLTRREDVLALNGLGIDFAGFIFVPGTPRCLDISRAARLTRLVPPDVRRVGVFLDLVMSGQASLYSIFWLRRSLVRPRRGALR